MRPRAKRLLSDLDQEIREHIELATQENIARGMKPEEASHAAMLKFGNVTRVKEDAREVWTAVWLEQFVQDMRFAVRGLRRAPVFTSTPAASLPRPGSTGIGVELRSQISAIQSTGFMDGCGALEIGERRVRTDRGYIGARYGGHVRRRFWGPRGRAAFQLPAARDAGCETVFGFSADG